MTILNRFLAMLPAAGALLTFAGTLSLTLVASTTLPSAARAGGGGLCRVCNGTSCVGSNYDGINCFGFPSSCQNYPDDCTGSTSTVTGRSTTAVTSWVNSNSSG
jgi:hypothetical protein